MSNSKPVTTKQNCYHASCATPPKWGVASSVEQKNPDGTDLTLYTCDDHYGVLTGDLKNAGTRYGLFPIGDPHAPVTTNDDSPDDAVFEKKLNEGPLVTRLLFKGMVITVGAIVGPFIILYFGLRWLFGIRPPTHEDL